MSGIANEVSGMDSKRWQLLAALARERGLDPGQLPIPGRSGKGPSPLSFAQERLWVLDQIEPGLPVYNEPYRARLTGPLDLAALAASLSEIVRRHEILRSRFPNQDGLPVQVVCAPRPLLLPVADLSALPAAQREAEAGRRSFEEASLPFDLAAGPVLRVSLIRLGETEHLLLFTLHHIVSDAASIGILVAELEALYSGKTLPEPALQYADYAAWQRDCLQGSQLTRLLDYWRERLEGSPPLLDLPTDVPRSEHLGFAGGERPLRLGSGLAQRLHTLARHEGATLFMLLLAAFDALLARLSGQSDVLVASPVAGRGRTELEGMVGFFVNTVVLRADLGDDPSFEELVRQVRKTALAAFD
ncbi:MAG TPA: condensation domain-containing protein, partial [Thermoanaerobaculia bacterium]|nr:condensation domain-containing protein [Thermoanaerobaculia bacterium]